jgi:hypothetical protein
MKARTFFSLVLCISWSQSCNNEKTSPKTTPNSPPVVPRDADVPDSPSGAMVSVWFSDMLAIDSKVTKPTNWRITDLRYRECPMSPSLSGIQCQGEYKKTDAGIGTDAGIDQGPHRKPMPAYSWIPTDGGLSWLSLNNNQRGVANQAGWFELQVDKSVYAYELEFILRKEKANVTDKDPDETKCRTGLFVLCDGGETRLAQGRDLDVILSTALLADPPKALVYKGVIATDVSTITFHNIDDNLKLCKESSSEKSPSEIWFALTFTWPSHRDSCL